MDYAVSMDTAAATLERPQSRRRVVRLEHRRTGIQHVQQDSSSVIDRKRLKNSTHRGESVL